MYVGLHVISITAHIWQNVINAINDCNQQFNTLSSKAHSGFVCMHFTDRYNRQLISCSIECANEYEYALLRF